MLFARCSVDCEVFENNDTFCHVTHIVTIDNLFQYVPAKSYSHKCYIPAKITDNLLVISVVKSTNFGTESVLKF